MSLGGNQQLAVAARGPAQMLLGGKAADPAAWARWALELLALVCLSSEGVKSPFTHWGYVGAPPNPAGDPGPGSTSHSSLMLDVTLLRQLGILLDITELARAEGGLQPCVCEDSSLRAPTLRATTSPCLGPQHQSWGDFRLPRQIRMRLLAMDPPS
jgi:hypothetical protein